MQQVHSNISSYHTSYEYYGRNKQSKCQTKQAKQQANHDDDSQNTDDEAEAATNGRCCCRGGESALAASERASNSKETQADTATYREQGKKNKNTCPSSFTARRRYTAGPIYQYSFCIVYKNMWCFQPERRRGLSRHLLHISHTPPISGKLKYSMDRSRQYPLNAIINKAEDEL